MKPNSNNHQSDHVQPQCVLNLKTFERIPTELLYKTEMEQMVKPYATESFTMLPLISSNSKSDSNPKTYLNSHFQRLYYFFMFLVHGNVNV